MTHMGCRGPCAVWLRWAKKKKKIEISRGLSNGNSQPVRELLEQPCYLNSGRGSLFPRRSKRGPSPHRGGCLTQ